MMRRDEEQSDSEVGWRASPLGGEEDSWGSWRCIARFRTAGQQVLVLFSVGQMQFLWTEATCYLQQDSEKRFIDYLAVRLAGLPEPPIRRQNRGILSFRPLLRAHFRHPAPFSPH